jgi:hypothetical protein
MLPRRVVISGATAGELDSWLVNAVALEGSEESVFQSCVVPPARRELTLRDVEVKSLTLLKHTDRLIKLPKKPPEFMPLEEGETTEPVDAEKKARRTVL